jgi:hypothetical protein
MPGIWRLALELKKQNGKRFGLHQYYAFVDVGRTLILYSTFADRWPTSLIVGRTVLGLLDTLPLMLAAATAESLAQISSPQPKRKRKRRR